MHHQDVFQHEEGAGREEISALLRMVVAIVTSTTITHARSLVQNNALGTSADLFRFYSKCFQVVFTPHHEKSEAY